MKLVKATPKDYALIASYRRSLHAHESSFEPKRFSTRFHMSIFKYAQMLQSRKLYVVMHENERIGYVCYYVNQIKNNEALKPCKYVFIDELYLTDSKPHKGVGKQVIETILEQEKVKVARVGCYGNNLRAMKLYKSLGFKESYTMLSWYKE